MTVEGQVDVTNSSSGTGGAINAQGKLHWRRLGNQTPSEGEGKR